MGLFVFGELQFFFSNVGQRDLCFQYIPKRVYAKILACLIGGKDLFKKWERLLKNSRNRVDIFLDLSLNWLFLTLKHLGWWGGVVEIFYPYFRFVYY